MVVNDVIGDMITRIRNAHMVGHSEVKTPASRLRENVLEVLKHEGYIRGFETYDMGDGKKETKILLKYKDNKPVISEIQRVSRPGRRIYSKVKDLPKVYNGLGISVLSTSKGIMSDGEACKSNISGEILFKVF